VLVGLGGLGFLIVAGAAAADDPAAVEKARMGHFKDIGRAAHVVQIEVGKPSPDAAAIGDAAKTIEGLAGQIPSWFPPGSGPETGVTTQARAEIWADPAAFRAKAAALGVSAQALEAAAASNDPIGLKSGFANLAQACQSCHTAFRTGEH
jgi:cytochrome c556